MNTDLMLPAHVRELLGQSVRDAVHDVPRDIPSGTRSPGSYRINGPSQHPDPPPSDDDFPDTRLTHGPRTLASAVDALADTQRPSLPSPQGSVTAADVLQDTVREVVSRKMGPPSARPASTHPASEKHLGPVTKETTCKCKTRVRN